MTHRHRDAHKKKKGGLLIGMRSGVKNAARGAAGETSSRRTKRIWNVVTVLLLAAAAVLLLRRFGVLHF